MGSPQIPVNPAIITWARSRAGFSIEEAAGRAAFKKIAEWEDPGTQTYPTYMQLEAMAETFKVPVAVFFFPAPPEVPAVEQTFRTIPEAELADLGHRIRLLLRKAKAFQISLAQLSNGRNPAPRLITKDLRFAVNTPAEEMAQMVRSYLGVSLDVQTQWANDEEALKAWRSSFQDVGIYVFKDAFKDDRFAGFCLTDPEFPIIYVNNSTRPFARQVFTLFHELAHLLFHTSGIDFRSSDVPLASSREAQRMEVLCNRFAGELLVPDKAFRSIMRGRPADFDTARAIAAHFNVSTLMIYRKFLDHRLIDAATYKAADAASRARPEREGTGGDHYNNKLAYLGRDYIGLALQAYHQQRITETQLAEHLNVPLKQIATLEERYLRGAA